MAGRSIVALCVGEPGNEATLGQQSQFSWGTLSEFRRSMFAGVHTVHDTMISRVLSALPWSTVMAKVYTCSSMLGNIINHVILL